MIPIDFDRFSSDDEFQNWLCTEDGKRVFNYVYDIVISSYGNPHRYIPVIIKKHEDDVYSIDMKNLKGFCLKAIKAFEYFQEYEKCEQLMKILKDQT